MLTDTGAHAEDLRIDELVFATSTQAARQSAELKAVKAFYQFWNTGDDAALASAIAPGFTDHTLPPGRPQGPEGPAFASKRFRQAVPDLRVEVQKLIFADDYVTAHMVFTGHFTGRFDTTQGKGQAIRFIATDLLKITDGRVSDNWHIEDNLALLTQMGVVRNRR